MDNPSFSEIKKRFDGVQLIKMTPPKPNLNHNESPIDPLKSERSKSNTSYPSFDDDNRTMSDPAGLSSQPSTETSSSREAILARIIAQGADSYVEGRKLPVSSPNSVNRDREESAHSESSSHAVPQSANSFVGVKKPPVPLPKPASVDRNERTHFEQSSLSQDAMLPHDNLPGTNSFTGIKKPPVPLPKPASVDRNERTHSESSSISQDVILPHNNLPGTNSFTGIKKPPVPLPKPASVDRNERTHSESSSISQDAMLPHDNLPGTNSFTGIKKAPVALPSPINQDHDENIHSESLFVSLDAMLPSRCMFFESENMINNYQRIDPRTIIYPKMKTAMPKMTTNEIKNFQRYLNT